MFQKFGMNSMDVFATDDNSTPLAPDEAVGLKLKWITMRSELNEAETRNILQSQIWLQTSPPKEILSDIFLRKLHKKMFGMVWSWAGNYRMTERNIGVSPFQISIKLQNLFDDVKFWIENKIYSEKEIAVRFHHKLVAIHPFPNGNGRISRVMADLLAKKLTGQTLYWGDSNLTEISKLRKKYIDALHDADNSDYNALLEFVERRNTK